MSDKALYRSRPRKMIRTWEESPRWMWTFRRTINGSHMFPIQRGCCGGAEWTAASGFSLVRFRCKLSYLAGRPMGNGLLFRPEFLEDPARSTWFRQTAAGPRNSRQGIITRLTRTGHQIRTRWCSEAYRGLKAVRRVPPPLLAFACGETSTNCARACRRLIWSIVSP
jgi:hypothetical protein